jgi:hypothetical protein
MAARVHALKSGGPSTERTKTRVAATNSFTVVGDFENNSTRLNLFLPKVDWNRGARPQL